MYRRLLVTHLLTLLGRLAVAVIQSIVFIFTTTFLVWLMLTWLAILDVDRTPEPYYTFPETVPSDRRVYVV